MLSLFRALAGTRRELSRRRLQLRPALAGPATSSATWSPRTTSSATCCATSAWRWSSASCCSTRWCRTRRWRCCWSIRRGTIVYANIAARKLLDEGRKLEGQSLRRPDATHAGRRCARRSSAAATACSRSATSDDEEIYHLARRSFRLNGRAHELLLLRQLTAELRRQEVQTWKKVIRVISHELNNSLAPVASLAHSGAELLRRGQLERLPNVARHHRGARAPPRRLHPRLRAVRQAARAAARRRSTGRASSRGCARRSRSRCDGAAARRRHARFDPAQMEQALLNLLKNAHESGSPPDGVRLAVRRASRRAGASRCSIAAAA